MNETEQQIRLRRAKEYLDHAKERQNAARLAFVDANATAKMAKERYEELFLAEEDTARKKIMKEYRHTTH